MSALIPLVALNQPGEDVLAWLSQQLIADGFRIVQTFDLQVARGAHNDCACPHHGTDECDCQMVVLLVYWKEGDPSTVVLHSQDGQTWLSLADASAEHGSRSPEAAIRRAVMPHLPNLPSIVETACENRSAD